MRLTDEKITDIKEYLNRSIKVTASSLIPRLSKYGIDLIDTIEALRQENEQLQEFAKAKAEGRLVKRGKWIYEHEWKCSSCGWAQSHDFNTIPNDILKYCPNCGAKMSKEAAEKALGGGENGK